MTPEIVSARNTHSAMSKWHGPDHPKTREARALLAELRLREQIATAELPADARSRLAALLLGGAA